MHAPASLDRMPSGELSDAPQRYRLTVDDFLMLNETGAFSAWRKSELLDGEIFHVNAQFNWHSHVQTKLTVALANALAAMNSHLHVQVEVAIDMRPDSMLEPDLIVTDAPFVDGPVPLTAVALVAEISVSTLEFDLTRRPSAYARHGVPEYWVVDVRGRRLLRHLQPGPDGYASIDETPFGQAFVSGTIASLSVTIDIPPLD